MTLQEIYQKVSDRFGPETVSLQDPQNGDPFVRVAPERFHELCFMLRNDPDLQLDFLRSISGVESTQAVQAAYPAKYSSVYHLYSYTHGHGLVLHVDLDAADPHVESVADIWPAAEWHERETYDLMGIVFDNHPYPQRILLPEDWDGHPLRKDYVAPKEYHGLTNE